jgi:hypothetical protein
LSTWEVAGVAGGEFSALLAGLQAAGCAPIEDSEGWLSRCPVSGCGADDPLGLHRPLAVARVGAARCSACGADLSAVEVALRGLGLLRAAETGEWRATVRPCSEIPIRAARWAWQDRIPLGSITLLVGQPGVSKSTLACELCARLSRGELPGDLHGQPAGSLVVSFEDAESTIAARLAAAGADPERVGLLQMVDGGLARPPSLSDLEQIDDLLRGRGDVRLLVLDPLSAALAADVDSHRDADMRRALAGLAALAERRDLAVIAVSHFTKTGGEDVLARVLGSRALTAAARSVLAFGQLPDAEQGSPQRLLASAKSNLGPPQRSLECTVEAVGVVGADGELFEVPRVLIGGEVDATAADLLAGSSRDERSMTADALEWLEDRLGGGEWHLAARVKADAAAQELSAKALRRARERLGVEVQRRAPEDAHGRGSAASYWRLIVVPCAEHDAHDNRGHDNGNAGFAGISPLDHDCRASRALNTREGTTIDGEPGPDVSDIEEALFARFGGTP